MVATKMYCTKCGKKLKQGWEHCPQCGAKVAPPAVKEPEVEKGSLLTREIKIEAEDMQWFDENKENIKEKEGLLPEQIEYIQKPSFTIFGPFNMIVRKQWDLLLASVGLSGLGYLPFEGDLGLLLAFGWLGVLIFWYYFAITHGRRLAWNRNKWNRFADFAKSEDAWKPWGIVFFVIFVLIFLASFIAGVSEPYPYY